MAPAPLVVWEGSHQVIRAALAHLRPDADTDLTAAYTTARRHVFATCPERRIIARPGQAVLLHRMLIHGVAPFHGTALPPGRIVVYFRPLMADVAAWLDAVP
jgi:hypothetical protein